MTPHSRLAFPAPSGSSWSFTERVASGTATRLWRRRGAGAGAIYYQGLILYASAWVHWERRNAHGVRAQLNKTLARLDAYPAAYLGLDVAELRAHCVAVRQEVAENPDSWPDRVTALPLSLAASRLRGDEVELEE